MLSEAGLRLVKRVFLSAAVLCPVQCLAAQPEAANLISNPSVETSGGSAPAGWMHDSYGDNSPVFSYISTGAHSGDRAVMITMNSWKDGDAKWFFKKVAVTPGRIYRFSDYYKASVLTSTIAEFRDAAGKGSWQRLGDNPKSPVWKRSEFTFTAPANAVGMTILHVIAASGTLQTDDYSLAETVPPEFKRAIVSIMFDDGYRSVHENAWPIMRGYGFKSTQYIISDAIGSATWFAHPLMTAAEIKDLYRDGSEIGSHSATHVRLSRLSPLQLNLQLTKSKTALNAEYPGVKGLALPYGDYDAAVTAAVRKHYAYCRTSDAGYNNYFNFDPYRIRVQYVLSNTSLEEIKGWLSRAARDKSWLAILYHNVDNSADDEYSVAPEAFAAQMRALHDSGLPVKTVQQALAEVRPQLPEDLSGRIQPEAAGFRKPGASSVPVGEGEKIIHAGPDSSNGPEAVGAVGR